VVAEAVGVDSNRFGEHPHVVVNALDDYTEMSPQALFAYANLALNAIEARIDTAETGIDPPKAGIHRTLEL